MAWRQLRGGGADTCRGSRAMQAQEPSHAAFGAVQAHGGSHGGGGKEPRVARWLVQVMDVGFINLGDEQSMVIGEASLDCLVRSRIALGVAPTWSRPHRLARMAPPGPVTPSPYIPNKTRAPFFPSPGFSPLSNFRNPFTWLSNTPLNRRTRRGAC